MAEKASKFSFFESFYDAACDLADEDRLAFYDAVCAYAFTGREPSFSGFMNTIWKLVKPNVDSSVKGQRSGSKGGRPPAKTVSEVSETPFREGSKPPAKPPVSDGGNPPLGNGETPSETDMDMDMDRDMDREEEEFVPLERTNSSSRGGAAPPAAAEAAPPPRDGPDGSRAPHCPLCDSLLRFNVESGRWSCSCVGDVKDGSVVWR